MSQVRFLPIADPSVLGNNEPGDLAMTLLRRLTEGQKRTVGHWAMEFAIVVVGVLVALWLQEWAERRRELGAMRAAEQAIHDEVDETLMSLIWREAISRCHRDRAELLQSRLLSGGSQWAGLKENTITSSLGTAPGSVSPSVYQRPVDTFTNSAWTSALATGALGPMDRKRFGNLVTLYDQIDLLRRMRVIEDDAAAKLSPLGHDLQLTPELRAEMLQAVYNVDRARFVFGFQGSPAEFANLMRPLGWHDKAEIDRQLAEDEREAARRGIKFRPCVAKQKNPFKEAHD